MDYKFIQPVSMRVTKEQYERDLREPLLRMGYKEFYEEEWEDTHVLVTNYANTRGEISNTSKWHKKNYNRHFIDHYNPKLFLAIAAMTDKESPIVGEWLVCTAEVTNMGGNKVGDFVKNENPNMILNWFRRATLQELIEKFTNQKQDIMKKELTLELIKDLKNLIAPENVEKFDELMGIEKPMFQKEDFITGDKVFTRDGTLWLVIKDSNTIYYGRQLFVLVSLVSNKDFLVSESYDDNLKMEDLIYSRYDIMKVYRSGNAFISGFLLEKSIADYDLIWSRE